ncbi:MAG: hypothetical protein HZB41_04475 [Ignavibacteriae bacterium]|nr:hypothetical protein [Ignavibacteriota bacterium]
MKMITKFLIVLLFLFFLFSCSEDNTTNPQQSETMEDYMPLTIGSWWKYEYYDVDLNGNRLKKYSFMLTVTGTKLFVGKQSKIITFTIIDSNISINQYNYAIEDDKLLICYTYPEYIKRYGWFTEADLNKEEWTIIDTTEYSDSIDYPYKTHEFWTIRKGGYKDFVIKDKTIKSFGFISEHSYSHTHFNTPSDKDTLNYIIENWYGNGVGFIYSFSKVIWHPNSGQMYNETILVDYEIK